MGKRSRKRAGSGDGPAPARPVAASSSRTPAPPSRVAATPPRPSAASPHARSPSRKARMGEAPPAPWAPFPLVELSILAGLVLVVVGFVWGGDSRLGLFVVGFVLIAVSAIEQAIREHFAGFRSHTTLLAASTVLFPVLPLSIITPIPRVVLLVVGGLVFAVAFFALRQAFARRAGGLGFRA